MLRAAELISKQASTFSSMSSGLGGFAALDFTNAMPTLDFNIDYAPPHIADAGEPGGVSNFASDFTAFESAADNEAMGGAPAMETKHRDDAIMVNDEDDRPRWARQDRYSGIGDDLVSSIERQDSAGSGRHRGTDDTGPGKVAAAPAGDDWFTEETVPSARSYKVQRCGSAQC
jgi:hypothetical protein